MAEITEYTSAADGAHVVEIAHAGHLRVVVGEGTVFDQDTESGPDVDIDRGAVVLDPLERVLAREAMTALLGMWASSREAFGDLIPPLAHAEKIERLIDRLA